MRNSTIGASALGKDKPGKDMVARLSTTTTTTGTEKFDSSGADLALTITTTGARIDSRLLAALLGNRHQSLFELVKGYRADFEALGILQFQTGEIQGRGQPEKFALLNEDQAYLVLTYSRNTARVRALKVRLVKAFREARYCADTRTAEYLPTYHRMHDMIHDLASGSPNKKFVHANVNKLVNKVAGVEAGQRASAPLPQQALLIVAQSLAARAMEGALDHRDGYQRVKQSMLALSACTMLGVG